MIRVAQWMIGLAVVAASGVGTFWLVSNTESNRLRAENDELARRQAELQRIVERLTDESRVAEVHVIYQVRPGDMFNGKPADQTVTTIDIVEYSRDGTALPSKRFQICDDIIHFDALVLKFDPELIKAGDPLRGRSLALFRRVYGEHQNPADGFPIDADGDIPNVYRVNPEPSDLERELWSRFWDYATNPELAQKYGVRIAQGEAPYVPVRAGQVWTLSIDNNGGLNVKLRRSDAEADFRPDADSSAGQ